MRSCDCVDFDKNLKMCTDENYEFTNSDESKRNMINCSKKFTEEMNEIQKYANRQSKIILLDMKPSYRFGVQISDKPILTSKIG